MKKHFFLLSLLISLTLGIGQMWGAEQTVSWSASAGALGTAISSEGGTATGTISTGTFSWNYTRTLATLKSGKSDYVAMSGSYMQLGSSNAGENVEFRTSNIPGTIKSVTVLAGSKDSRHTGTITVGGTDYNAGAISAWANNAGADWTGTGTSSGEIVISISCNSKKSPIYIASITVVYEESGSTPTCATPTFSVNEGTFYDSSIEVELACTTTGAAIHYTLDGSAPTASSATYSSAIEVSATTTIKAIAVKQGLTDSDVASATYTKGEGISGYNIDFESNLVAYVDWNFVNLTKTDETISAHGGSYFAKTNGTNTASITTKDKIAYPGTLTYYISKIGTNTNANSKWKARVSSDGTNWTIVGTEYAAGNGVTAGTWNTCTADLTDYSNVYVQVYYDGTTAVRTIDDVSLTMVTPGTVATPSISGEQNFTTSTTVTLGCTTDDAYIYYTTDGTTPSNTSTAYSAPFTLNSSATVKAIAIKDGTSSSVAEKAFTKIEALTTMDAIFTKATAVGTTATDVYITFNNWVVTGVKNNNAYVTDGTKGLIIYQSSHGFVVGNKLSGTVACKVQLYKGSSEITSLTKTTTGLTVTTGGTVTPVELNASGISALTGVNTGSVIKISGECTTSNDNYDIAGVQLYNTLFTYENPTAGKNYNCTGVYVQYNSTKEILPRSAADIEEIAEEGAPEAPTFSPTAGTYTSDQNVEISCATDGATIYYTTNGTTPTSSSTPYTTAISVGETMTIKAIAVKNDKSSSVATAEYIINNEEKTHTWNLAIDETATASDDELTWTATYVSMSFAKGTSTTNANNYYPGTSGKSYTSTRIYKNGVLTITPSGKQITKVEFMATSNDYATALKNSTWTNGVATIDNASPQYVVVTVSNPGAVSAAIGGTCGFTSVKVHYTAVDPSIPADPTFSPAAGTYTSVQNVEISCETEDATIYYTTDGTTPTSASTQYSSAISVSESMTIKAIAIKESKSSSVVSAAYTINIDSRKVAASPEGGFSSISGDLSGNEISFAAYQGGSATPPNGNNTDHELRLYKYQTTTNYGGYVTITAKEGCTIDQVVITVGGNCKVGYCKDAEDFPTKESTPISVGTSNPFDSGTGLNASSVNVISLDGSNQFKIKTITVYYTGDAVAPPTPSEDEISDYVLVTDLAQLQAGDKVIIVAADYNVAAGSAAATSRNVVDITKTSDKSHLIFGASMPTEFTLGITNEGKYTFHDGNGYMYEEEAKKVKNQADPASWTITIGEGNIATIQATNELRYNSGNPRFTTYASGQQSLQLYRKPGFEELRPNLEQGRLYSACMTQNIIGVQGGILWDISHYEGSKVYFEEIVVSPSAPLVAGRPFIFMVTGDFKVSYSGAEINELPEPNGNSALRGTFVDMDQDAFNTVSTANSYSPIYMLVNNQLRQVADYTGTGICTGNSLAANRAYLLYSALNEGQPNLAPGRRVMTMSVEENVATDINFSNGETINASKIIRNGQILILRDGKTFDVTGRELR